MCRLILANASQFLILNPPKKKTMVNATSHCNNNTPVPFRHLEISRITYLVLIFSTFSLYLSSVLVILCVVFTTSHIRESVRYLLLSHMLISDSLQLTLAFVLLMTTLYLVYIPVTLCCIIAGISTTTTLITPYNLALMSLEHYIAVCSPLRHGEICTVWRCYVAIMVMWSTAAFPIITELIIFSYFKDNKLFSAKMVCIWTDLQKYNFQSTLRFLSFSLSFGVVLVTIFYTYIKVMLVARKIGLRNPSASKAAKTVLLHGFHLLLCLCSYSSTFTETLYRNDYARIAPINFFVFYCLPQYISPFLYGIRDEVIFKCIRKLFFSA
ncbi:odorant receptor 131-2-like [Leptodactylus fuscus]